MASNNSQFSTVKSRIYDHLQPPREISPVGKIHLSIKKTISQKSVSYFAFREERRSWVIYTSWKFGGT